MELHTTSRQLIMKKQALTSILVFFSLSLFAQINIDSLIVIWNDTTQPDTVRLQSMQQISLDGYLQSKPDSAFYYAQLEYELAQETGHRKWMALASFTKGTAWSYRGEFIKALEFYTEGLKISEELQDKDLINTADFYTGIIYWKQGKWDEALNIYLRVLSYFEEVGNEKKTATILSGIGQIYYEKGDYTQALSYLTRSSKLSEKMGDKITYMSSLNSIGAIYIKQKDYDIALDYYLNLEKYAEENVSIMYIAIAQSNLGTCYIHLGDFSRGIESFSKALEIAEEMGLKRPAAGIRNNIGSAYFNKGDYKMALEYQMSSLKLAQEIGAKPEIAGALNGIGVIYEAQKNYTEAIIYGSQALAVGKGIGSLGQISAAAEILSRSYKATNQYEDALEMFELHIEMRDSLNSEENRESVMRKQFLFSYEEKALADSLRHEKAKLIVQHAHEREAVAKRKERNIILVSGILILLTAVGLWSRLKFIRKTNIIIEKEKKEAENQQLKAEQSEAFKQQFFSNISHEFRTPLTLILGPLDRIIDNLKNEEQKQELNLVKRNARRLQTLINQLLSLSKLESGKMKLKASPENIVKLAKVFLQSFHSLAEYKGIKLEFESDAEDYIVYIDTLKFEKITNNLLSNSFKFTEKGGKIKVSLSSFLQEEKKGVIIKFSDTGIGIRKENVQHVFDRFYQVDEKQLNSNLGSGIGLALTKELVELHHGTIQADSEYGMGTTFSIFLPLGKDHLKENEIFESDAIHTEMEDDLLQNDYSLVQDAVVKTEINSEAAENSNFPLLLIIEDNNDMRSYIRSYLTGSYTVIEATNGKEGAEKAIEHVPDLIITDLMMPGMDGNQMTNQLKNDERTSHIPIILLTAKASMESKLEGLETGADDFLTKPFDASELLVRIKNLINQRKRLSKLLSKHIGDSAKTSLIKESLGRAMSRLDEQFLEKAKNHIDKHMANPDFGVEMLAKQMTMSRVQLHRKLKNLTDHSASGLIRDIRMMKAAELLKSGELNVTQVSYDIGISGLSNFAKHFKEKYGVTPSEYMKI